MRRLARRSALILLLFSLVFLGLAQTGLKFLTKFFKKFPLIAFLRPPGAGDEDLFLELCVRCRACANVCEAGCIKFFALSESLAYVGTPYLFARTRACNLCMNCTQVCPTGALTPIVRDMKVISQEVKMGLAKVEELTCLSFNGRVCGICHDVCPLKGKAITLKSPARPVVHEACIGCGRCEEHCPQTPSAIRIEPEGARIA